MLLSVGDPPRRIWGRVYDRERVPPVEEATARVLTAAPLTARGLLTAEVDVTETLVDEHGQEWTIVAVIPDEVWHTGWMVELETNVKVVHGSGALRR